MKKLIVICVYIFATSCAYIPIENEILLSKNDLGSATDLTLFKVLSWNIQKQADSSWYTSFNEITEIETPYIILLQEAKYNKKLKKELKGFNYNFSPNLYETKDYNYSGVLIASKIKPESMNSRVSNGREPSIPFIVLPLPKATLFNTYILNPVKKEVLVVNIHSLNFTAIKLWNLGGEYDEQIMQIVDRVNEHDGPVVVGGDFNTWSSSRIEVLKELLETKARLTDHNFGVTQGTNITKCNWALKLIMWQCGSRPLDHIFYKKLNVVSSTVLTPGTSDHNPLVVEFSIP